MASRFANSSGRTGFTLVEMLLVLIILSTMVAVTLPYASRSHDALRLEQEARNLAEAIRYATQLAEGANRSVRILWDTAQDCYSLQMATPDAADYLPIDDPIGALRHLDSKVRLVNLQGFESAGQNLQYLTLDPQKPWPEASLDLAAGTLVRRVQVTGRLVEVKDAENR
jgi:prepilin-type N-terminal cleavage/methylation domain-containing protein